MAFQCVILIGLQYMFVSTVVYGKPVASSEEEGRNEAKNNVDSFAFLLEKGYIDSTASGGSIAQLRSEKSMAGALELFQGYVGIPVTGKLDAPTIEYMKKPRCGMADMKDGKPRRSKRQRRYTHQGTEWKNRDVTWALENSNDDGITDYEARHILTRAFGKWSSVTNLNFRELYDYPENSAKIRVRFVRRRHGDPYSFDGPGGTLAHAFYPLSNRDLAGDVHFDDDEEFTIRRTTKRSQKKLLWVAVHEIGHSVGLEHSEVRGAIMWPYYQHFEAEDFDLTYDDIVGVQTIYGGKMTVAPPTRVSATTTRVPATRTRVQVTKSPTRAAKTAPTTPDGTCVDKMTAPFIGANNKLYFVSNGKLYMTYGTSRTGVEEGPLPIWSYFHHLRRVDAVFKHPYYRAHMVFHGEKFSVYEETKVRYGGQRKINDGFQGIDEKLEDVDATIVWPKTGKLYMFKGEKYWRLEEIPDTMDYIVEKGYPQSIAVKWHGLPKKIDSAFKWTNDKIYFTKDDLYYRWDERKNAVHSGYPVKLSRSFLKCG